MRRQLILGVTKICLSMTVLGLAAFGWYSMDKKISELQNQSSAIEAILKSSEEMFTYFGDKISNMETSIQSLGQTD